MLCYRALQRANRTRVPVRIPACTILGESRVRPGSGPVEGHLFVLWRPSGAERDVSPMPADEVLLESFPGVKKRSSVSFVLLLILEVFAEYFVRRTKHWPGIRPKAAEYITQTPGNETATAMFEFIVLIIGAMPFLVGLYAIKMMKKNDNKGSDDQPPPPDPNPPLPVLPPSPEPRRVHRAVHPRAAHGPMQHTQVRAPKWTHKVRCGR